MPPKKPAKKPPKQLPEPPLPLAYMLAVIADETATLERRDEMARMAAPYLHAKADAKTRAAAKGKSKTAQPADTAIDSKDSDADPIIRTARAVLERKLARLAAKERPQDPARQP